MMPHRRAKNESEEVANPMMCLSPQQPGKEEIPQRVVKPQARGGRKAARDQDAAVF